MKNDLISKKVFLEIIKGWQKQDEYYHGRKATTIPISEVKTMLEECPLAGDDSAYIKIYNKRLRAEYHRGANEVLRSFEVLNHSIKSKFESEDEE